MVNKNYQHLASSDAVHNYAKHIKHYKRLKAIYVNLNLNFSRQYMG